MIDDTWIRNLAAARFTPEGWVTSNTQDPQVFFVQAVQALLELVHIYASQFNRHAPAAKRLRILSLSAERQGSVILMGRNQLRLETTGEVLRVTLIRLHGYCPQEEPVFTFLPSPDRFGGMEWREKQDIALLAPESVVKKILCYLVKETVAEEGKL